MDWESVVSLFLVGLIVALLYRNRKKVVLHKIFFPLLYVVQYKDRLGIGAMEWCARPKRFWKLMAPVMVGVGFLGMVLMIGNLAYSLHQGIVSKDAVDSIGIVQPFMPDVPGTVFVPFLYFLISVFIIAVIHECMHGVMAYVYDLKIKASGFAVVGLLVPILPAAFVEPDEVKLKKRPAREQLAIFAAGPFANLVLAFVVVGLLAKVAQPISDTFFIADGLEVVGFGKEGGEGFPAESSGLKKGEVLLSIDSSQLVSPQNLSMFLEAKRPGDQVIIATNVTTYTITLASHPKNESKPYLGVVTKSHIVARPGAEERYGMLIPFAQWTFGLFLWMFILSLGVGLFNLLPLGPVDGGRMLLTLLECHMDKDSAQRVWGKITLFTLLLIVANLAVSILK